MVAGINFPNLACQLAMGKDFPRPEYQLTRYTKPEKAFKLLLKKYFRGDTTIHTIKETGLPFTLRDPGPEFAKYVTKKMKSFSRN
jgi:hypothetical protein